MIIMTIKKL